MALVGSIFFDTSVLLAGTIEMGEVSQPAQSIMDAVADQRLPDVHTAWHCCLEYYAVATRLPEEFRLTPTDALNLIQNELLARLQVSQLPQDAQDQFFQIAIQEQIVGGRIYDFHIAEVAQQAGMEMVITDNRRHFASLLRQGIPVLTAGEFAARLRSS